MSIIAELIATVTAIRPLSFALEHHGDRDLRDWVRTQPPAVVAVVDLALVEGNEGIVAGLLPDHVAEMASLTSWLAALDDESSMSDADWLAKHLGPEWAHASNARGLVERQCEQWRSNVRTSAMFVASLTVTR